MLKINPPYDDDESKEPVELEKVPGDTPSQDNDPEEELNNEN